MPVSYHVSMHSRLSMAKSTHQELPLLTRHSQTRLLVVVSTPSFFDDSADQIDYLQVAIDVTSDGQLQLPPYPSNPTSAIYNITIFLSSYTTGYNFTISNGTATANNASLGEIMAQEPGSTVKHVNWLWPDCLVGDGSNNSSPRGAYNVSCTRLQR